MELVSNHEQRALSDNCIPVELGELLGSLARKLTRDVFQVEIDRRLGALLRVAGIDLRIVPHETEQLGSNRITSDQSRLALQFADGDHDLLFTFGLAALSERSKQGIYDTAITVLSDYLKAISPLIPLSETLGDVSISPSFIEVNPTAYTPPYNAAGFAHRLRNLLSGILSGADQLASTDRSHLDSDDLLLVKTIVNASTLQSELISRYLMAYGPLRLTLRPLDLGVAIRSAVEWHDSQFNCRTEITSERNRTEIVSDSNAIRQIIIETLRNAHEDSAGETVTLHWSVAGRQALITIKNRGQIKGTDFDSAFERPFFTTKSGHAGLGLCVARRYADYLGGTIKGKTSHGHTVVTICLPLARNENISQDRERESQCPPY